MNAKGVWCDDCRSWYEQQSRCMKKFKPRFKSPEYVHDDDFGWVPPARCDRFQSRPRTEIENRQQLKKLLTSVLYHIETGRHSQAVSRIKAFLRLSSDEN